MRGGRGSKKEGQKVAARRNWLSPVRLHPSPVSDAWLRLLICPCNSPSQGAEERKLGYRLRPKGSLLVPRGEPWVASG
jgi:hypothetical protein